MMNGKPTKKRLDGETKIKALQRHAMEKVPVSQICQELNVQPSAFYIWQRELYMRGASLFDTKPGPHKSDRSQEKVTALEARLVKKDEVIAELLEEHVALKKTLGVS